jgi:hypothetical protein
MIFIDMKEILIKSLRERILLFEYLKTNEKVTDVEYTSYDGSDKFDATWLEDGERVIAEVKVRNYPMSTFNTWIIEKIKYDFLVKQNYDKKLYINFHSDGIQIWDLNRLKEPIWSTSHLPKNNQSTYTIDKSTGDLYTNDSIQIKKEINIDNITKRATAMYNKKKVTNN